MLVRLRERLGQLDLVEDDLVCFGPNESGAWQSELDDAIGWLAERELPTIS